MYFNIATVWVVKKVRNGGAVFQIILSWKRDYPIKK